MCSKRLRNVPRTDWAYAYRINVNVPPTNLHTLSELERALIAQELVDKYEWPVSRAAAAVDINSGRMFRLVNAS